MESDSEKQLFLLNVYKLNKNNGADFLKEMLEGLSKDTLDFIDT